MKKMLLSVLGAVMIVGSASTAFADYNFGRAVQIHLGSEVARSIYDTQEQYFYFIPSESGRYRITLSGISASEDADLFLYNESEVLLDSSRNGKGQDDQISADLIANQKYYVKAKGYVNDTSYRLLIVKRS
ncbi:PPC domain-containing protein [Paenibacillus agilis]|uniref:Peptidase C-terminal archaeal/bacterial domain-containing protein n=1 Tax=Paenibacillus agilis TaxID=3020863 RepID=A0A559J0T3_9BACL|nr:PPC domain-containing protein [Paenibacillus agilis]TVX93494.1 hypothetical protein FPZ44_10770 [Paenibacillus agilis]